MNCLFSESAFCASGLFMMMAHRAHKAPTAHVCTEGGTGVGDVHEDGNNGTALSGPGPGPNANAVCAGSVAAPVVAPAGGDSGENSNAAETASASTSGMGNVTKSSMSVKSSARAAACTSDSRRCRTVSPWSWSTGKASTTRCVSEFLATLFSRKRKQTQANAQTSANANATKCKMQTNANANATQTYMVHKTRHADSTTFMPSKSSRLVGLWKTLFSTSPKHGPEHTSP